MLIAGFFNAAYSQQVKYPALQTSNPMNASQLLDIGGKLQVSQETRLLDDVYLEKLKNLSLPSDRYVTIGSDGKLKEGPPLETTPPGGGNGGGGMTGGNGGGGGQAGLFWKLEGNDQITSAHWIGTINTAALIFKTNNNEWVRISESGNVGVGIASPQYKLHVSGSVNASQYYLNGVLVDVNLINSNIAGLQSAVSSMQLAIDSVQLTIGNQQSEINVLNDTVSHLTSHVSNLSAAQADLTSSQWQNTGTNSISYTGNVAVNGSFQSSSITTTNITITDKITTKTAEFDTLRVAERMEVEKYIQSDTLHALSSLEVNNSLTLKRDTAMMYAEVSTKDTAVALMFQKEIQATVEIGEAAPPAPGEARAKLTVVGDTKLDGSVNVSGNISAAGTISATNVSIANDFITNKIITNRITTTDSGLFIGDSSIFFQTNSNRIFGTFSNTSSYKGLGLGVATFARGTRSTAIGKNVSVSLNADNAIIVGSGISLAETNALVNNIPNSLMVGFNTSGNTPTLYVGPANGTANSTGNVGIGTTNPGAALEVKPSEINTNVTALKLNSSDASFALNQELQMDFSQTGVSVARIAMTSFQPDAGLNFYGFNSGINATPIVTMRGSGNVGVGTTNPLAILHVASSTNIGAGIAMSSGSASINNQTALTLMNSDATAGNYASLWFSHTSNPGNACAVIGAKILDHANGYAHLDFATFGSVSSGIRMRITDAGWVGIGTTAPLSSLHTTGTLTVGDAATAGTPGNVQITTGGASPALNRLTFGTNGTVYKFAIAANNAGAVTDLMTIQADGKVGIGTANPGTSLDIFKNTTPANIIGNVNGSGLAFSSTYSQGASLPGITWYTTESNLPKAGIWTYVDNSGSRMYLGTTNSYASGINNTAIAIESDGRVGIGMAPGGAYRLDVLGTVRACRFRVESLTGCDFVFGSNYNLLTLKKRKEIVLPTMHLLNVPPANEMQQNGADLGETTLGILQNVEEHELYLYNHDERIEVLEKENKELRELFIGMKKEMEKKERE